MHVNAFKKWWFKCSRLHVYTALYDDISHLSFLAYDCPVYDWSCDYATYVAGASYTAAHCLIQDFGKIAINWPGGWHHAKRSVF